MRISTLDIQRNGINSIISAQSKLLRTSLQISTQKNLLNPADDPLATSRIRSLSGNIQTIETYQSNNLIANNQLSLVENTMDNIIESLLSVDEIHKQGANGTLNNSDKEVLAKELEQLLDELIGLVNTKDTQGSYIFSGYKSDTSPYFNQDGVFNYQGDNGQRFLEVGGSVKVPTSFSGYDVFENVLNGNGVFQVSLGAVQNTGSAISSGGNLVDASAYIPDQYSVEFVTNSSGELAYQIVGANTGQVIPPLPATIPDDAPAYAEGNSIIFNGMEVSFTGTPNVGDDFSISPSERQNIFTTVDKLITALRMPTTNSAETAAFLNEMTYIADDLDQGFKGALQTLTIVGANMSILDNEAMVNTDLIEHNKRTLSNLEDLDPTEGISRLVTEMTALEAAQASFMKIQQLSLFNYI